MKNNTVKVWNKNSYEHSEKFKGQEIKIPAGGFVEMNYYEAVEFKSQFKAPVFLKGGVPDPKHFKMIVLEEIVQKDDKIEETNSRASDEHICQMCGFTAKSNAGLKAHVRANHLQSMENEDARKELIAEG